MTCPFCQKETSTILRFCENCKEDLEKYHCERNKIMEGTGDIYLGGGLKYETLIINWGPFGGLILSIGATCWFIVGLQNNTIYIYPPFLFILGIVGMVLGLNRINRRNKMKKAKKNKDIID